MAFVRLDVIFDEADLILVNEFRANSGLSVEEAIHQLSMMKLREFKSGKKTKQTAQHDEFSQLKQVADQLETAIDSIRFKKEMIARLDSLIRDLQSN